MSKVLRLLVLGGLFFAFLPLASFAATELSGTVKTPDKGATKGKGLIGVVLHLQRNGKDIQPSQVTDVLGKYRFKDIKEPGEYTLKVEPPAGSFKEDSIKVTIKIGVVNIINITLAPLKGDITTVISKEPPIKIGRGETSYDKDFLENTANIGKDIQSVIAKTPGVTLSDEGEIIASGTRKYESQIRLGNTSVSDAFAALGDVNAGVGLSTDAIENVQVTTSGRDASETGVQGASIKIIPKSGSDVWERSAGVDYESSFLGRDFGYKWQRASDFDYHRITPSFIVGGPIIRGEMTFFSNLVLNTVRQSTTKFTPFNGLYRPFDYQEDAVGTALFNAKYRLNPKHTLGFLYSGSDLKQQNYFNFFGESYYVPEKSDVAYHEQRHFFEFSAKSAFGKSGTGKTLSLESTLGYIHTIRDISPVSTSFGPEEIPCSVLPSKRTLEPGVRVICDGDIALGPHTNDRRIRQRSIQLEEKFSWNLDDALGGDHRLMFGGRFSLDTLSYSWFSRPIFFYDVLEPGATSQFVDVQIRYNQPREDELRFLTFYFQDDWELSDRWTVTLGINLMDQKISTFGYEPFKTYDDLNTIPGRSAAQMYAQNTNCLDPDFLMSIDDDAFWNNPDSTLVLCYPVYMGALSPIRPASVNTFIPTLFNYLNNATTISYGSPKISPTLKLIWRPFGDEKTAVVASLGRYYGTMGYTAGIETSTALMRGGFDEADTVDTNDCDLSRYKGEFGCYALPDFFIMDRDIRVPYTDEWQVQVSRAFTDTLGIDVRYVNRRGKDQIFEQDINFTRDTDGNLAGLKNKNFGRIRFFSNFEENAFEAVQVQITKHMDYRGRKYPWLVSANYNYQKASGVSEDFFGADGGDPRFTQIFQTGPVDNDQRHTVNISVVNMLPGDFRLGTTGTWNSGLPFSYDLRTDIPGIGFVQTYQGGRNQFRNPSYWTMDLNLSKDFKIGKRQSVASLSVAVENVFNYVYLGDQSALINAYQQGSLGGVGGPLIETSFQNVQNAFVQPFYGLGRNWQLTFKYKFGNKPQKL